MRNREIAHVLKELTEHYPCEELVRCKDCIYHEPFPDTSHRDKNSVYCSVYDLVKLDDGFCESGTDRKEN